MIIESRREQMIIESRREQMIIESRREQMIIESRREQMIIESRREQMIIESRREQMIIDFDEMIMVSSLYQTNELLLDLLSLKQQSAGRHATPLGHIIPIPIQPMFTLSP
jgi:hypothetical protein